MRGTAPHDSVSTLPPHEPPSAFIGPAKIIGSAARGEAESDWTTQSTGERTLAPKRFHTRGNVSACALGKKESTVLSLGRHGADADFCAAAGPSFVNATEISCRS